MRHHKVTKTLDRNSASRLALLRGLATNFVLYEKVKTTTGKAKVLRPIIERLVTHARTNNLTSRRYLSKYLYTEGAVKKMLEVFGPRYQERAGGYTRIVKLAPRRGDGAAMAQIEFVK